MATNPNTIKPINPRYASKATLRTHTLDYIKSYLYDKIDNSWYRDAYLDYNVTGHVISITTCGPNNENLAIKYAENHDGGHPMYDIISECEIPYYSTYTPDQLYAVWQDSL